jgi:hypothetical protein
LCSHPFSGQNQKDSLEAFCSFYEITKLLPQWAAAFYNKAADENCYLTADCLRQGCCKETVAYFSICTIFHQLLYHMLCYSNRAS